MLSKTTLSKVICFYPFCDNPTILKIPFAASSIAAGFPSPATDYIEKRIDLNKELIKNPTSTFFARVSGFSMKGAGIEEGDILIIDKSLQPQNYTIAVCCLDGEFTLKRIRIRDKTVSLIPENEDFEPIHISDGNELIIWGIVTHVIKSF